MFISYILTESNQHIILYCHKIICRYSREEIVTSMLKNVAMVNDDSRITKLTTMANLKPCDQDTESAKLRTLQQGNKSKFYSSTSKEKHFKFGIGEDYTTHGTLVKEETTQKGSVSTSKIFSANNCLLQCTCKQHT